MTPIYEGTRVYDRRIVGGEPHYRGQTPFVAEARGPKGAGRAYCRTFQDAMRVAAIVARGVGAPCDAIAGF